MMKWLVVFLVACFSSHAQIYTLVDRESAVLFSVKNLGVTVTGTIGDLRGQVQFDPDKLHESFARLSLGVATIRTGIGLRDRHLQEKDYLDGSNFPRISLTTLQILRTGDGYVAETRLVMKGLTRIVKIPFSVKMEQQGPVFEGDFRINRHDFDVGASAFTMADIVRIHFSIAAKAQEPADLSLAVPTAHD